MIRYRLSCATGHEFEAWFASIDAFDRQSRRGLVSCPECASTRVEKCPMAPAIVAGAERSNAQVESPCDAAFGEAVASLTPASNELIEAVRAMKNKLLENSEYVGKRFAEEARQIHFGERQARAIHGEMARQDAHDLHEDGIAFGILPRLPGEQN